MCHYGKLDYYEEKVCKYERERETVLDDLGGTEIRLGLCLWNGLGVLEIGSLLERNLSFV